MRREEGHVSARLLEAVVHAGRPERPQHCSTNLAGLALALERATKIVDHDVGASRAEEGGICLSQSTAGTGDDDRLAVKAKILLRHDFLVDLSFPQRIWFPTPGLIVTDQISTKTAQRSTVAG